MKSYTVKLFFIGCLFLSLSAEAQKQPFTLQQSIAVALQNNLAVKSSGLQVEQQKVLSKTANDFGKTNIGGQYGQANSIKWDTYFNIQQPIPNPSLFKNQKAYYNEQIKSSQLNLVVTQTELTYQVKSVYYQLSYFEALQKLLHSQDTLFAGFLNAAELRYKTGESNLLEKTTAETQLNEIRNRIQQNHSDILIARKQLEILMNVPLPVGAAIDTLDKIQMKQLVTDSIQSSNPQAAYVQQQINVSDKIIGIEKAKAKPDFSIGYFNQSIIGTQPVNGQDKYFGAGHRFQGMQAGISIPLFNSPFANRIKAAKIDKQIAETQYNLFVTNLNGQYQQAYQEYIKDTRSIEYFEKNALPNSNLILKQAQLAFKNGEIGYVEYLLALKTYRDIRSEYLNAINNFNQSIVRIQYLSNQ
ncbi:MAG TPA: TolC family protein [Chitinophagaceae bacterium]|nr:TolC family protein [Chitinophagaceae bacterium]